MGLSDDDRAAVRAVFDAVANADLAMDLDTLGANLTDDHTQLDPRAPAIHGREAWRAWADELGITEVNATYTLEELGGGGDFAYVVWSFDGWWTEGEERIEGIAKGITLFERQPDGTWLQSHVAWNMDPEPGH
jgi:ketosteroid isomerase-like protein